MPFGTQSAPDTYARNLYNAASEVFSLSRSKLNGALVRGYRLHTYAAPCAHPKNGPLESIRIFDHAVFLGSLARLEDWSKASMVAVLVEGHTFDIKITRWPAGTPRRNEPGDLETSYHISLNISEADGSKAQGRQPFALSEFTKSMMNEKFRVDSGRTYRVTEGLYVSHFRNGRDTLRALVTKGRWGGEAFIYGTEEQLDDSRTLQWIKSSVAKAVLPTTSNRVVCDLRHPDKYDPNARRIEIRPTSQVLEFLDSTSLHFEIPVIEKRFFVMDDGCNHTVAEGVIVDGFWDSAVNSNGITEAENPTPLEEVRARLQITMEEGLSRAGCSG